MPFFSFIHANDVLPQTKAHIFNMPSVSATEQGPGGATAQCAGSKLQAPILLFGLAGLTTPTPELFKPPFVICFVRLTFGFSVVLSFLNLI